MAAREVAGAIIASTLTTCVIFLPVVFARTTSGALFQALALVVVFALACSLLVALTLVPMLASRFLHRQERRGAAELPVLRPLPPAREPLHRSASSSAIRHRGRVFAATGGLLAVALLLWPLIPVELAPRTEADEIDIELEMARGTNIAVARVYLDELERKVRGVVPDDDVKIVSTEVRGDSAAVELKLEPRDRRSMGSTEMADRVRARGGWPGARSGDRRRGAAGPVDAQPGVQLGRRQRGGDRAARLGPGRADRIAADIRQRMERLARRSPTSGSAGARVSPRSGCARPGTDRRARPVGARGRQNVAGQRRRSRGRTLPGGRRRVPHRGPAAARGPARTPRISTRRPAHADGETIPLSALVERERGRGPVEIERVDGQRVTYVSANLESGVALGDAVEGIRDALADLALPEGFALVFGGQYEEQQAARRDFTVAIVMALVLVYMLMAAQFERFLDPLIVMLSVPVALVGVVPALLLTGTTLNIQSLMGLMMLIGIVVNNAIVLVDAINLLRRDYRMGAAEAVIEAGRLRLRPILMTTGTTVLGLLPLALGLGTGAEIQAPLARVVIGGLLASTLVTLVLIPVAYAGATGLAARIGQRRWSGDSTPELDAATAAPQPQAREI